MNILDDILNDKNINNNFKKIITGESMSENKVEIRSTLKDLILLHINQLKEKGLWWAEDEKLFQDKYGISSDDAYKKIREGE